MSASLKYRIFIHVAALLVALVILAPFAWMATASITEPTALITRPYHWIPSHLDFSRYKAIFAGHGDDVASAFRASLVNSTIVAVGTVVISMSVGVLGAYAFAMLRFRLRRVTMMVFLTTYMLPPIALLVPLYLIMSSLGLLDSDLGLIIIYCSYVTPFVLWILSNYFSTIPAELEEAARVDGCSRMGALFRIMLPAARPGLFATIMFAFILAWDEFLYALIFTSSSASKTIPVAIADFTGRYSTDFGLVAAGGLIASVPPVLLAVAFQKFVVGGLSAGAVKG
ncbi:binding-protein-dependent transport systems inner membrane component [Catenulispora acidiphila DSM 44928]|uniref:Binding-protein-dependent transport systems inner membrane component n=1 Tax=Catenulispora acidiphila (strain DSM 44928 / JCM 14897 / NBRC 102108 / NRRL B-24433 / ID139908) TaxID=479433 RepID=C7PZ84_CATAD|nr:carbohydrate ABC transporter permease [Catenulispora acidiphila]ACU71541.1 binding-protein-dependent transport systems inner membrane component [Catenulispora acidiphila DSM 44928]